MNEIRYFSMFTGVGGFEVGLAPECGPGQSSSPSNRCELLQRHKQSKKGFTCIGMSEWDKYSSQVLKYRFPDIKNWGDCTKIRPNELPDFDMLCGGFPCQSFSIAGKRKGFKDTRGTLFFEIARILEIKRPKIILLENVKGLLNHNKGETFRVIIQTLSELGYDIQWMVFNSKFFGVSQNRERVFIIGSLRGEPRPEILPFGAAAQEINLEYVGAIMSEQNQKWLEDGKDFSRNFPQGQRVYSADGCSSTLAENAGGLGGKTGLYAVLTPDRLKKRQNGRRFKEDGEPSFTLTGQDIHGVSDGYSIRRLTPVECCRLQGFPDDWNEFGINEKGEKVKMSDTQRYKQMGNAVTTNVIKAIGNRLLKTFALKDGGEQ